MKKVRTCFVDRTQLKMSLFNFIAIYFIYQRINSTYIHIYAIYLTLPIYYLPLCQRLVKLGE